MAGLVPIGNGVLGGMASFGIGHIAYLGALFAFARIAGWPLPTPWMPAWLVWLLVGLACWYFIVLRPNPDSDLALPALGYVLLLASTAGCASQLAVRSRAFLPLALGAALFFVSDLMIALEKFAKTGFPGIGAAIWLTYGPAQMLIVYSTVLLSREAAHDRNSAKGTAPFVRANPVESAQT
jgi:uncharacterized membrane protein YhhN